MNPYIFSNKKTYIINKLTPPYFYEVFIHVMKTSPFGSSFLGCIGYAST